jgi:hypothetical protein
LLLAFKIPGFEERCVRGRIGSNGEGEAPGEGERISEAGGYALASNCDGSKFKGRRGELGGGDSQGGKT